MGVIIDNDVLDVCKIIKMKSKMLSSERSLLGAHIFVREMAKRFYVMSKVQSTSLFFEI